MDALLLMAERATRLLAEGRGKGWGPKPSWLRATLDFTFVGLRRGSTLLDLKAPCLGDTADRKVFQGHLWRDPLRPEDTALDLAAYAIKEARDGNPSGARFDRSVLQAIQGLGQAAGTAGVRYELEALDGVGAGFVLDDQICQKLAPISEDIPAPKAYIVSGRLDQIMHRDGHFRLIFEKGKKLTGRVDSKFIDIESLRPHWGKPTTIEGIVSFRSDGRARLIEARRIRVRSNGDCVFDELPTQSKLIDTDLEKKAAAFDPMTIIGKWPGDESVEELLSLLS